MLIPDNGSIHLFKVQSVDGVPCFLGTVNHSFDSKEAVFVYDSEHKTATAAYPVSKRFALYPVAKDCFIIDYKNNVTDGIKILCYRVISVQSDVIIAALIGTVHFSNNIIKGEKNHD